MTFDLKAQPASISSAICGLRRIVIVFSSLANKMEMEMEMDKNGQAPLQVGFLLFHLPYRYLTMSGEECSDQLPSSYLCLHFFCCFIKSSWRSPMPE